jgi:hypothetical protein
MKWVYFLVFTVFPAAVVKKAAALIPATYYLFAQQSGFRFEWMSLKLKSFTAALYSLWAAGQAIGGVSPALPPLATGGEPVAGGCSWRC